MNARDLPGIGDRATWGRRAALPGSPDFEDDDAPDATLEEFIAARVGKVFRMENGNVSRTAQRLGVDRNTVKRWLEKAAG